jgi:hypothetical protein
MVELRRVDTFDEAGFAALTEPVFGTEARGRYMSELVGPAADERNKERLVALIGRAAQARAHPHRRVRR